MIQTNPRVARAYDALASEYDAQLEQNPVAREMRARLHAEFAQMFRAGDRVLDLTAGTGIDARFLAAHGVAIMAIDVSAGMITELQRAAAPDGLAIESRVLAAEDLSELKLKNLDGVISTFGGLNTIDDLPRLARDLNECLRPRGRVLLHALNSFCLWQWARGLKRGHPALSRRAVVDLSQDRIPHRFYNPYRLWRDAFAEFFGLQRVYAMSVLTAPPLVKKFPRAAPALFALDRFAGHLLPAAGDFFVMEMEKRDG